MEQNNAPSAFDGRIYRFVRICIPFRPRAGGDAETENPQVWRIRWENILEQTDFAVRRM